MKLRGILNNKYIKVILSIIFLIYFGLLIRVVIFKFYGSINIQLMIIRDSISNLDLRQLKLRIYLSNFIPFKGMFQYSNIRIAMEYIIGNIVGFIPFGFILPFIINKMKKIKGIILSGFFTSIILELIQFITGIGSFDINDLILNTTGVILGFILYRGVNRKLHLQV